MATYMVVNGEGNTITDGLQDPSVCDEAVIAAQEIADDFLVSVWLVENTSDGEGEEFKPNPQNPVVAARLALRDWEPVNAGDDHIMFVAVFGREPTDDDELDLVAQIQDEAKDRHMDRETAVAVIEAVRTLSVPRP